MEKIFIIFCILVISHAAQCQWMQGQNNNPGESRNGLVGPSLDQSFSDAKNQADAIQNERNQKLEAIQNAENQKELALAREKYIPRNPWRKFGSETNFIKDAGAEFCGKILEVQPNGVRISGGYSLLFHAAYYSDIENSDRNTEFFVENFPFEVAEDEVISESEHLMAKYVGTYTYTTVQGGSRTIRKLDYGISCDAPQWYLDEQAKIEKLTLLKQEVEKQKQWAALQRTFHGMELDATNGDRVAQFSVGICYLTGKGCETNQENAIYWLQKSASQGYLDAANKLQSLKPSNIAHN